ncbi:hypothetical protein JVU11DRAFT_5944 [Chiua virens]|nr:hypothetical protein JVU11DRAFT_5944 [Chiua virens]
MNNYKAPPVPTSRYLTLIGGITVVSAGLAAWCYGLLYQQAKNEERGMYTPWEYRILQAQAGAGNPDRPTMSHQPVNVNGRNYGSYFLLTSGPTRERGYSKAW